MKKIFLITGLFISTISFGQNTNTIDFINDVRNINFSDLWTVDSILIENEELIERMLPLGFIGENFQRFHIHFISVIQNPENPLEYFVYGKTKVKNNICNFQGIIKVNKAKIFIDSDLPPLKQGYITGDYKFYEDKNQKYSGYFNGHFKTSFYFNSEGKLEYDALSFVADGFENNQFEGIWTSYKTGISKKCNWGDYRIPDSKNLDCGAARFGPSKKYDDFGWENFNLAWGYSLDKPGVKEARAKETEKWWIETEK